MIIMKRLDKLYKTNLLLRINYYKYIGYHVISSNIFLPLSTQIY